MYLLYYAHHIIYVAAYMPEALEVFGGIWDWTNLYSLPQALMFWAKLLQKFVEACYNLYLVSIPRPCSSSWTASSHMK